MWKVVVLIAIITICGCVKEQADTKFAEVSFNIDRALLEEEVVFSELGISFNPPKGWESTSPNLLDSLKASFEFQNELPDLDIELNNAIMNLEKSFVCFVWIIKSDLLAEDIQNNYLDYFRNTNPDLQLNKGAFAHNKMDFRQITFVKDDFITIKLLTSSDDENVFMLDYVLPTRNYEEELRSIESSIGSIK